MKFEHLPELKRALSNILDPKSPQPFPVVYEFNEGMEFPTFTLTIEKHELDTFVDSNGQKWKKVK